MSAAVPAYARSVAAGRSVSHPTTTQIADGVAARQLDPEALAVIMQGAARLVEVSGNEVRVAMKAYFTDTHNVAEGAGAVLLAALMQERDIMRNKQVGLILCGGNVEHEVFAEVLRTTP